DLQSPNPFTRMNPFAAARDLARKTLKRDSKEMSQREDECLQAIMGVLNSFNCELRPRLIYAPHGILPDIEIVAKSLPKNDQPGQQFGDSAPPTGGATTGAEAHAQVGALPVAEATAQA